MSQTETVHALVLNGGSSSGKTTLAKALQELLDGYWLRLSVDTLIDAAPQRLTEIGGGLEIAEDGSIMVGPEFRELDRQWSTGVAAMAHAGAHVIIEDNFLGGRASQQRWLDVLGDLPVGWIGVRCPSDVAAERETKRGDRPAGMAAQQADSVHQGVAYDLEVDTSIGDVDKLARTVRDHFALAGD